MLQKLYKISDGTFNPPQENPHKEAISQKYKNLKYFTLPFEEEFSNVDNAVIFKDITEQQDHIRKEISLYEKYWYFNKAISDTLTEQYKYFYYYKWYYYKIDELRLWLTKKSWYENTFIRAEKPEIEENTLETNTWKKKTLVVSREAIRKITWYSSICGSQMGWNLKTSLYWVAR